jgi:hypothetical protein
MSWLTDRIIAYVLGGFLLASLLGNAAFYMQARHWKKQSSQYEQLWHDEQTAHAVTVANYRAAADTARRLDAQNAKRVKAEQSQINERSSDDYQKRIADARARAQRLRGQSQAGTHSSGSGATPVSGVSAPTPGTAQVTGANGFPVAERLVCTEQSIQLDELIKWVRRQHDVDVNGDQQ